MNPWLLQIVLGSLGLTLAAFLAGLWLRLWRRDPLASYRMAVTVLLVTICMPLAQWGAKRWDLPRELAFVNAWAEQGSDWINGDSYALEVPLHLSDSHDALAGSWVLADASHIGAFGSLSNLNHLKLETARTDSLIASLKLEEQALLGNNEFGGRVTEAWYQRELLVGMDVSQLALIVYGLGLLCSLMRTALRLKRTKDLLQDAIPVRDAGTLALWRDLMKGSPLAGRVQLLESQAIRVPMCFGLGTPAVVLPPGGRGDLDAELFSCVLLHELVHLERRDTWVMLGQEFARSLFWFHPAAWWLCSKIDLLRELSCDLLVVRRTGRRKRYATALVEYAARMRDEFGPSQAQATALLPWSSSTHQLSRRIEMLVKLSAGKSAGSRRTMFLAAGSLFGMLWGGQLATAAAMAPAQEGEPAVVDITDLLDAIELGDAAEPVESIRVRLLEPRDEPVMLELIEPGDEPAMLQRLSALGYVRAGQTDDKPIMLGISIEQKSDLPQVRIVGVNKGSLAERSGLKEGDIIVRINGADASVERLMQERESLKRGKLKLELLRGEHTLTLNIKTKQAKEKKHAHSDEHGNVHFGIQGNAHTLPGAEGHRIHVSEGVSAEAPQKLFIDESGTKHEIKSGDGHANVFSWSISSGDQHGRDAHALHEWKGFGTAKGELHELLKSGTGFWSSDDGLDMGKLHEHIRQATEGMVELHGLDLGDLHQHLKDAKFNIEKFRGHWDQKSKDSNSFKFDLKHDGDHGVFSFDGVDIDSVRSKIQEAIGQHPDSEKLRIVVESLHNLKGLPGNVLIPDMEKIHELIGKSKAGKYVIQIPRGEWNLGADNVRDIIKKVQVRFGDHDLEVDMSQLKEHLGGKYRNLKKADADQCTECGNSTSEFTRAPRPHERRSNRDAELDRMRALLNKRQAELQELQRKLESLRHRER